MVNEKNELKKIAFRPTQLVNSKYQLTPVQNDIIDFILTEINEEKKLGINKDKILYQISAAKYKDGYDVKDDTQIYRYIKRGVDSFQDTKGFWVISKVGNPLFIQWFSSIEYLNKQGIIEVELSSKFKEFLWYSKQILFYEIKYSINLKNKYSKRLYYYLKDKRKLKEYTASLDDLSNIFMLSESYAGSITRFEDRILKPAMNEINSSTDITFTYDKIKGRKKSGQNGVVKIKFYISAQVVDNDYVIIPEMQEYEQIVEIIKCEREDAKNIYEVGKSKNLTFDEILEIVNSSTQLTFISDKVGFIIYTINQLETKEINISESERVDNAIIPKIMDKLSCSEREAKSIKSTADKNNRTEDDIFNIINYTLSQNGIDNKAGYIVAILKNGFINIKNETTNTKKKNQFNNFSQRNYSEEEMNALEKRLLMK